MSDENIDATVRMEKTGGRLLVVMESPTVTVTLTTTGGETPEHLNDMVMEFPDAVYAIIEKAMVEADVEPS